MKLFSLLLLAGGIGSCLTAAQAQQVVMNEVYPHGTSAEPDWIELYNASGAGADISGYKIYDSGGQSGSKPKKVFPQGTTIPSRGFFVVVTDDGSASGFGLSSSGETVWLENAAGTVIDTVTFPALATNKSYGRYPDGALHAGVPFTLLSERTINVPEPSGLAYHPARNSLFCVSDANNTIYELSPGGDVIRQITVSSSDMEAITFSKNYDTMFVAEEGTYKVVGYTLQGVKGASWSIVTSSTSNSGYEGLTRLPNDDFVVLNEKSPTLALRASHKGVEISRKTLSLASDLSDICYDSTLQCYWLISDESKKIMKLRMDFSLIAEWTENIEQGEGIAVARDRIYIVSDSDSKFYIYTKPQEAGAGNPWGILNRATKGQPNSLTGMFEEGADASGFALSQCYPNPFNPSTTIQYTLPYDGFVTLTLYDFSGRQAAQIVRGQQSRGTHAVVLSAQDLAGGVYFYRLIMGNKVSTKKVLLLK